MLGVAGGYVEIGSTPGGCRVNPRISGRGPRALTLGRMSTGIYLVLGNKPAKMLAEAAA